MANVTIQVLDNAPYLVKGDFTLLDGSGKVIETSTEVHLCRCGLSKNLPHCDGSHVGKFESSVQAK